MRNEVVRCKSKGWVAGVRQSGVAVYESRREVEHPIEFDFIIIIILRNVSTVWLGINEDLLFITVISLLPLSGWLT